MTAGRDDPDPADPWTDLLEDAASIAEEYRERDWTVVTVDVLDVVPWTGDGADADPVEMTGAADRDDPDDEDDPDEEGAAAPLDADDRRSGGAGDATGGLLALATDDAYEAASALVEREAAAFDAAEVYRRSVGDAVLAIAVELDAATEAAIVLPLYYRPAEARDALEAALDAGALLVHLRPRSGDDRVTFVHDDPSLFVAEADGN